MSSIIFIASDSPLSARPNPHEKMMSVNEALKAGVKNIPSFTLSCDFDRDKKDVLLVSDSDISIDTGSGTVSDGNFDDDFAVLPSEKLQGMRTEKAYCAVFEWTRYTPGRAEGLIRYLQEQLLNANEIELWHTWLDDEPRHQLNLQTLSVGALRAENIAALTETNIWHQPCTDCCLLITR